MLINKRGYDLIKVVLFFAFTREGSFPVKVVSERTGIAVKVLEQVLLSLKNGGVLASKRGPGGGYTLKKDVGTMSVADILRLSGRKIAVMPPPGGRGCDRTIDKVLYRAGNGIEQETCRRLKELTVGDLVKDIEEEVGENKLNYMI
jgi:Rrf2 family protein